MDKIIKIIFNIIPIFLMIALISLIEDDYFLTSVYILIIAASFFAKYEKDDALFLLSGFIIMLIFEYLFINMGVETFNRTSLLGIMPIWLPFLWSYVFVVVKRFISVS